MAEEYILWEAEKKPQATLPDETAKMEKTEQETIPVSYVKIHQSPAVLIMRLIVLALIILALLLFLGLVFDSLLRFFGGSISGVLSSNLFMLLFGFSVYVLFAFGIIHQWRTIFYELHPEGIIFVSGSLFKTKHFVEYDLFHSISLYQGLIGRWLSFGTIELEYGAPLPSGKISEYFSNIPEPEKYLKNIKKILERKVNNSPDEQRYQ